MVFLLAIVITVHGRGGQPTDLPDSVVQTALHDVWKSTKGPFWAPQCSVGSEWSDINICSADSKWVTQSNVVCNSSRLVTLNLSGCNLVGAIPASIGNLVTLTHLGLSNNQLTGSIPESFGNLTNVKAIDLSNNTLGGSLPSSWVNLHRLEYLRISNCSLTNDFVEEPFPVSALPPLWKLDLTYNDISAVGEIMKFCDSRTTKATIDLTGNAVEGTSLKTILDSFGSCGAAMTVIVAHNNVTEVPPQLLNFINNRSRYCTEPPCLSSVDVSIDLSFNPLISVSPSALTSKAIVSTLSPMPKGARIQTLCLNLSFPLTPFVPPTFVWDNVGWSAYDDSTFNISLGGNPLIHLDSVCSYVNASSGPQSISLFLHANNYTYVGSNVFNDCKAAYVDLSYNRITRINYDAFGEYNLQLRSISLAHNQITFLSEKFFDRLPAFEFLYIAYNNLTALPAQNNHLFEPVDAVSNVLQCESYGPTAVNCTCEGGLQYTSFCGYARCVGNGTNGCYNDALFNSTDCRLSPFSQCVDSKVPDQYYSAGSFHRTTLCSVYQAELNSTAYEVKAPMANKYGTATSDRLCSVCSVCPAEYLTVPCTATTNARCVHQKTLTPGDIASIVLSVILLLALAGGACVFGRERAKRLKNTVSTLENTAFELENTEENLENAEKETALMERAWEIDVEDLEFGPLLGEGASSRVYSGTWGHIDIAIKLFRAPIDSFTPEVREMFKQEVDFNRSIRHPNLLIMLGAGIDSQDRAYLVMERMTGNLRDYLDDKNNLIGWELKIKFALDIALGMKYLHSLGAIHLDLKAENCFLDAAMRVKVADFGSGHALMNEKHNEGNEYEAPVDFSQVMKSMGEALRPSLSRTLTGNSGSTLWMPPEAMEGKRMRSLLPLHDVYSFGVVMFEIWTRQLPWDEIEAADVDFVDELKKAFKLGVRPRIPPSAPDAPVMYNELMERCWVTDPKERPNFDQVADDIPLIIPFITRPGNAARQAIYE